MKIGKKLKRLRVKSGLSQEKVAEQLYVSRQAISKWENDEAFPDMENMVALAKFYNVSIDYILASEDETKDLKPLDAELVDCREEDTGSSKISKWQKWYTAARCTLAASTLVTIINYILQLCNLNGIPFLSYLAAGAPSNLLFYGMHYTGRDKEFEEMINSNPGFSYDRQPDIVFYMVLIFTSAIILGYVISVIGSGKNKTGFLAIGLLLWIGDCLYPIGANLVVYIVAMLFGNYSFAQIMQILLNFNFILRYIVHFAILAVLIIGVVCSVKIRKAKRAERKRQAA
jgi:transcriptional regulator with XRE-family HTH domain